MCTFMVKVNGQIICYVYVLKFQIGWNQRLKPFILLNLGSWHEDYHSTGELLFYPCLKCETCKVFEKTIFLNSLMCTKT